MTLACTFDPYKLTKRTLTKRDVNNTIAHIIKGKCTLDSIYFCWMVGFQFASSWITLCAHTTIESLLPKKERKPTFYYKCLKKKCFSQCGNLIPTECCICGLFFMLVLYCPNGNLPMGNMVRFLHEKQRRCWNFYTNVARTRVLPCREFTNVRTTVVHGTSVFSLIRRIRRSVHHPETKTRGGEEVAGKRLLRTGIRTCNFVHSKSNA